MPTKMNMENKLDQVWNFDDTELIVPAVTLQKIAHHVNLNCIFCFHHKYINQYLSGLNVYLDNKLLEIDHKKVNEAWFVAFLPLS